MNGPSVVARLIEFVKRIFKTDLEVFFEALRLSPNAQGYVGGSITELLLKREMENKYGLEVKRIREKWEGRKHPRHFGDFYFRRSPEDSWFVLESKGIKSNSEKWHKLYNYGKLKVFLIVHSDKIAWLDRNAEIEPQIVRWLETHLPKFQHEYADNLYEYEEVREYLASPPKRATDKARAVELLRGQTREELNAQIKERLKYITSRVGVLETHFVSGTSGSSERMQATPRKDEFNVISVDIFLRDTKHRFLFANPKHLDSSGSDPNHLQQNYVMGFIFTDEHGETTLSVTPEWDDDLNRVLETLHSDDRVDEADMQVDNRNVVVIGLDEPGGEDE